MILRYLFGAALFGAAAWLLPPYVSPYVETHWANSQSLEVYEMSAQLQSAVELHRVQLNKPVMGRTRLETLQFLGFLKKIPVNPVLGKGGGPFQVVASRDVRTLWLPADLIVLDLGFNRELCEALSRRDGDNPAIDELPIEAGPSITSSTSGRSGCFKVGGYFPYGVLRPDTYVFYSKV